MRNVVQRAKVTLTVFILLIASSTKVFAIGSSGKGESEASAWARLYNYGYMLKSGAFYKPAPLIEILKTFCGSGTKTITHSKNFPEPLIDTTMDNRVKRLKVAFVSVISSTMPPQVHLFRNYNYPHGYRSRYLGNFKTELHLGLRASSAAPSFFPPYEDPATDLTHLDGTQLLLFRPLTFSRRNRGEQPRSPRYT